MSQTGEKQTHPLYQRWFFIHNTASLLYVGAQQKGKKDMTKVIKNQCKCGKVNERVENDSLVMELSRSLAEVVFFYSRRLFEMQIRWRSFILSMSQSIQSHSRRVSKIHRYEPRGSVRAPSLKIVTYFLLFKSSNSAPFYV